MGTFAIVLGIVLTITFLYGIASFSYAAGKEAAAKEIRARWLASIPPPREPLGPPPRF